MQAATLAMMDREIEIPGPLRLLHGETSTVFDLILVYAVGAAAGVLALVFAQSRVASMEWWKAILLFVVAMDVSGGAVACFTPGTALYYESRPRLRWVFIFVHFVEPGLLFVMAAVVGTVVIGMLLPVLTLADYIH